jgi:hypothetical protein
MQPFDIAVTKVDELGILMAKIAELEAQADAIKAELKQTEGKIEGNLYKACVTLSQRNVIDNKAVFAEANIPAELIAKHTKTTAVITLKVTAR